MLFRALSLSLAVAAIAPLPSLAEEAAKPVKLMTLERTEAGLTRQFFGQVVARQTVDLAFQVGGKLEKLPIVEGQSIAAGDLIAELDLEPFQLALDQAVLQKTQADRTLNRLAQLSGNTVSEVSVQDAETQASLATIALRNADYALENATLKAPFDGLVASRNVSNFATIAAGTPIARLHDMSDLRIDIDVPELLFQRAGNDPDVEIFAQFPTGPEKFPLAVREFNAETSAIGQTYRLTLGMAPPEDHQILPGSSVTVFATLREGGGVVFVPATALATDPNGAVSVFIFDGEGETGTLRKAPVEIRPDENGALMLISGAPDGAEIVVAGVNALSDGQAARRFTGFSN